MSDLRKKLEKRAREQIALTAGVIPKSLQKTPSQTRSENIRRKDAKRAGVKFIQTNYPCDCHGCPKEPCGQTLEQCSEKSMVHQCTKCGQRVRHRVQEGTPWMYCPPCKEGLRL
jgi:hypothetical protein